MPVVAKRQYLILTDVAVTYFDCLVWLQSSTKLRF